MWVFTARGSVKAAVVINDTHLDWVYVKSFNNKWGVCVSITRFLERWFCVSTYCRSRYDLEQYTVYLDEVVPRCYSYGGILSETFLRHNLFCLNVLPSVYKFKSSRGISDMDLTSANVAA